MSEIRVSRETLECLSNDALETFKDELVRDQNWESACAVRNVLAARKNVTPPERDEDELDKCWAEFMADTKARDCYGEEYGRRIVARFRAVAEKREAGLREQLRAAQSAFKSSSNHTAWWAARASLVRRAEQAESERDQLRARLDNQHDFYETAIEKATASLRAKLEAVREAGKWADSALNWKREAEQECDAAQTAESELDQLREDLEEAKREEANLVAALEEAEAARNDNKIMWLDELVKRREACAKLEAVRGEGLRPEVMAFARLMESKLRKHDGDRGQSWKTTPPGQLLRALDRERVELIDATNNAGDIRGEAADVANFAMMVADRMTNLRAATEDNQAGVNAARDRIRKAGRTVHLCDESQAGERDTATGSEPSPDTTGGPSPATSGAEIVDAHNEWLRGERMSAGWVSQWPNEEKRKADLARRIDEGYAARDAEIAKLERERYEALSSLYAARQEVAKLEAKLAVANSWAEGMAAKADELEAQAKASMDGVVLRRLRSVTSEQGLTTHQRWMRMDEILRAHSAGGE